MPSRDARFLEYVFDHVKSSGTLVVQDKEAVKEASSQNDKTDQGTDAAALDRYFRPDSTKNSRTQSASDAHFEPGSSGMSATGLLNRRGISHRPRNHVFADRLMKCTRQLKIGSCIRC